MSSRDYEADWERNKNFLIRSSFHDLPDLSTIRETGELAASPHHAIENQRAEVEPLPDLIVERVPKRRNDDESELFYHGLRKRMRRYYRILFDKERDGSSSPDCEDLLYRSTYSRAGFDNDVEHEQDLNNAFVEDFEADNDSNITVDETLDLEETEPFAGQVLPQANEDEISELVSAAKETAETEETDDIKEKSVSRDASSGENDEENVEPGNSLKYTDIDSESTTNESLILPAPTHQRNQANVLQATGNIMQLNEIKIMSRDKSAGQSNHSNLRKDADQEKDTSDINSDKETEEQDEEIRKDESTIKENVRDSCESDDNDPMNTCDTENNEQSGELIDKDITVAPNNSRESSSSVNNENSKESEEESDKSINKEIDKRCSDTETLMIGNELMEVEVMRSQNRSPSTQSLEASSNSTSPPNIHVEKRDEIMLRHSLVSDRHSMGVDVLATRAIDISETSPDDFHPFLRCSTPIPVDRCNRDENMEVSSPTQFVESDQIHRVTKSLVGKPTSDANVRQSANEGRDEIVEVAAVPPHTEDKVTEASKSKEYKNATAQTNDRAAEKENVFVDIGVQVQEAEKEVNSVHVQTDGDIDDEPFGSRWMSRRRANYFIFL